MNNKKIANIPRYKYGYKLRDLSTINHSVGKTKIFAINYKITNCLNCGSRVVEFMNFIPIDSKQCVMILGKFCFKCESFYEENGDRIEVVLNDNIFCKEYKLLYDFLIPNFQQIRNKFNGLKSAVLMVNLKSKSEEKYKNIIIVEDKQEICIEDEILHYRDVISRKIITDILYNNCDIELIDGKYKLLKLTYSSDMDSVDNIQFRLKKVILYSGGGFFSDNNNFEVVDALLYSPYTKQLELAYVTYDKENNEYYMDVKLFRRFISKYGNPGIPISFYNEYNSNIDEIEFMSDESLLHAYGYNVSQESGYSDLYRHELLSEVIDIQLMTPTNIINLLEYNIRMHPGPKYEMARKKWERDIEFVCGYKINPKRFIVFDNQ